jgi:LmbE family N-acetylglucosaminyl deacetylase
MRTAFLVVLVASACGVAPPPSVPDTSGPASLDAGVDAGAAPLPTLTLDGGVVLWVGAHPDDESMVAPLFSDWCTRARCVLLVLTRGEGGNCGLPGGCLPDLATVRVRELEASARLFDAGVVQETLSNASFTATGARDVWVAEAGGEAMLVERIARHLRREAPDVIVTFDPLHGGTCHGEHRTAAALAMLAADAAGVSRQRVVLVSSLHTVENLAAPTAVGFVRPDGGEATHQFTGGVWTRQADVMRAHPSQFSAAIVRAAETAPERLRTSFFRSAEGVQPSAALDTRYCP